MPNSLLTTATVPSLEADDLEDLLTYLKDVQQVDLTCYKRSSLLRRTRVHMQQVRIEHYNDYLNYLKRRPDEVKQLLNTVFINFTYFFRDRAVWNYLEHQVIPQIIANKAPNEPIRVWSAGCASGEETYSLAMLLAEALGPEQFHQRVRIYGTDVDQEAILQARNGHYSSAAVTAIPVDRLERYFEYTSDGYRWRQDLRHPIIFHPHNLLQTPPLTQIDLLVCRNTLMYFTSEAQLRALVRFYFGLRPTGFLLLGQSESLVRRPQTLLFTLANQKAKVYTKVPNVERNYRLRSMAFRRHTTISPDSLLSTDVKMVDGLAHSENR